MSWVQYGKDALEITTGNEDGFNQGDLRPYGQRGYADFFGKLDCVVNYTSGGTVTGMTEAQAITYLQTLTLDLRIDTEKKAKGGSNAQDPANIFHPLQAHTFDDLRLMNLRAVEKDMLLLTDTSTGLRRSYTAGTGTITFTMYFTMGMLAQVKEWQQLYGVGPDLLELLRLKVRAISDGLNAFSSSLTTNSIDVTVKAFRRKTNGDRAFFLPLRRRYQPGANQRQVSTHEGVVPLDAVDVNQKLSTTNLEEVTVEVGGETVWDRETPAEIRTAYVASNSVAAPENTISNYATELYMPDETPFELLRSGGLTITQEAYHEEWDLVATLLPSPSEEAVMALVKALASTSLKEGEELHFVNSLAASGLVEGVPGRLLPAGGLTYWKASEPQAQELAGLRVDATGRVRLYIPPKQLKEAAEALREAVLEVSDAMPTGNVPKMDAAVNKAGRGVPAFVVDEVRGFPSSAPGGGAMSNVYRTVRKEVRAAAGLGR